jgi:hypothetical protein
MAANSHWFGNAPKLALEGGIGNLESIALVAILCTSTYTPDADADVFISDISNELSGGGYARVTLTGVAVTYDSSGNITKLTSSPIVFTGLTGTFRFLVIAADIGADSASPLIKWTDYDADTTATAQDVTITPAAGGLASITAS